MANRSAPCSDLRSIIVPVGVLDSDRDNVIYIPAKLQNLTTPLYVKRTSKNVLTTQMLPTWNDELSGCGLPSEYFQGTERMCSALDSQGYLMDEEDEFEDCSYSGGLNYNMIGNDRHNTFGMCDYNFQGKQILYMNSTGTNMKMPVKYAGPAQLRAPLHSWNVTVVAPQGVEPDVLANIVQQQNFPDPNVNPMDVETDYDEFAVGSTKRTSSPNVKISYQFPPAVLPPATLDPNQPAGVKRACFQPSRDAPTQTRYDKNLAMFNRTSKQPDLMNTTFMRGPPQRPMNATYARPAPTGQEEGAVQRRNLSGIEELEEENQPCQGACDIADDSYDEAYETAQDDSYGTDDTFMSAQGSFYGNQYGGGCGGGCG